MANTIKLKRSSTPAAVPASLSAGELAINLVDRKLYFGNGSSVLELSGAAVTVADAAPTSPTPRNGDLWWNSITGELFIRFDDGSSAQWVGVLSGDLSGLAAHLAEADPHASVFDDVYSVIDALAYARSKKNLLINGCFRVAQRPSGGAANGEFDVLDRWKCLADTTSVVADQTTAEDGSSNAGSVVIGSTSNKKFGIVQFLEAKDAQALQGKTVTFSVRLKANNANVDDVRVAILSWTGTADSPTNPVSAWGASGTNPTWATSWTQENTPADLDITTDWATYSVTATLDTAAIKNVAVFVFSNSSTPTTGQGFLIDSAQLEVGADATEFERRLFADELALCQRYFCKHYAATAVPGCIASTSGNQRRWSISYPVVMRIAPVVSVTLDSGSFVEAGSPTPAMLVGYWTATDSTTLRTLTAFTADAEM